MTRVIKFIPENRTGPNSQPIRETDMASESRLAEQSGVAKVPLTPRAFVTLLCGFLETPKERDP